MLLADRGFGDQRLFALCLDFPLGDCYARLFEGRTLVETEAEVEIGAVSRPLPTRAS